MRIWHLALAAGLVAQPAAGFSHSIQERSAPPSRQLSGLSPQQADDLIAKLEQAQYRLASGKVETFELVTGSTASDEKARISPYDIFLRTPFARVWEIEKIHDDRSVWQSYSMAYAPNGLGKSYWDIDVSVGTDGRIERIAMIYKLPAPF